MIPFPTQASYQNLTRSVAPAAPISVHPCDYPGADAAYADEPLAAEMRAIKRLNGLALSAREAKKIKVRQPLAQLRIGPRDDTERRT